jgi:hypothetical protein
MKTLILLAILMASCTPQEVKMADDFLEGEVQTMETLIRDAAPTTSTKPAVVIQKSF